MMMARRRRFDASWLVACAAAAQLAAAAAPGPPTTVQLFELFELHVATALPFEQQPRNPYNFTECRVAAMFQQPADLGAVSVDGFYMVPYKRSFVNRSIKYAEHELLVAEEQASGWYVRYAPQNIGPHRYNVSAVCGTQPPVEIAQGSFEAVVSATTDGGFVQPSPNRRHFQLSRSGDSFLPVGQDIAWPTTFNGSYDTDTWLTSLGEHGGNFARVWMCANLVYGRYADEIAGNQGGKKRTPPQSMVALEQEPYRYDQRAAWRFDQTLRTSRRYGIRILATLESFSTLRTPPALCE
jgi:hypothetical protein